jgi:hypothetical protein
MQHIDAFRDAINEYFAFLTNQYGFHGPHERSSHGACLLTFASDRISLSLTFGPPEFEPSLSFWSNANPGMSFSLGHLMMLGHRLESWESAPGTEGLEARVSWLASAMLSVGPELFTGAPALFDRLAEAYTTAAVEHLEEETRKLEKRIREEAREQFREGDFRGVVELLGSLRYPELMKESERRILEMSRRKLR